MSAFLADAPVTLEVALPPGPLVNPDIAPTPLAARTWGLWNIASLWVAMSVCIPTYMLASSMIQAGMNWWQSLVTILLGNAIVLVPLVINAHAGTRYGIPFPVFVRAPFGWKGAHVPSLLRAVVACGWFGIQTWIGGLREILAGSRRLGAAAAGRGGAAPGAAPGFTLALFLPWLTAMVGYWATLSLNIPDFTRYAASQRDQVWGQAIGLLTTMPLFAFVGIAATSATVVLYGEAIWNPIDLVTRLTAERMPWLGVAAMAALALATLSTNIAANVVAPANSFSNLAPRRISFRVGGMIAGVIGILILPWRLLDAYQTWLISYSGLLGAVGGVLICDYWWVRGFRLELADLYSETGAYAYEGGVNRAAMIALAAGIFGALAGKLHPGVAFLFDGAWFSAALISFVVYAVLMRNDRVAAGAREGFRSRSLDELSRA